MAQNSPQEPYVTISVKELFDKLDARFDALDTKVDGISTNLNTTITEYRQTKATVEKLESTVSSIRLMVARWSGGFAVVVFFAELALSHFVLK